MTPGPGAYQPPSNLFNKTLGNLDREERGELAKSLTQVPGPGAYNYPEKYNGFDKRGAKFGKDDPRASTEQGKRLFPGPGQYSSKQFMGKDGPSISIGMKRPDTTAKNQTPGPGTY